MSLGTPRSAKPEVTCTMASFLALLRHIPALDPCFPLAHTISRRGGGGLVWTFPEKSVRRSDFNLVVDPSTTAARQVLSSSKKAGKNNTSVESGYWVMRRNTPHPVQVLRPSTSHTLQSSGVSPNSRATSCRFWQREYESVTNFCD